MRFLFDYGTLEDTKMTFQSKHIENDSYEKLKSMAIVIAIKCSEGVVIATDSKGTTHGYILSVKKIYQIYYFMGLEGAETPIMLKYLQMH